MVRYYYILAVELINMVWSDGETATVLSLLIVGEVVTNQGLSQIATMLIELQFWERSSHS